MEREVTFEVFMWNASKQTGSDPIGFYWRVGREEWELALELTFFDIWITMDVWTSRPILAPGYLLPVDENSIITGSNYYEYVLNFWSRTSTHS